MKTKTILALLSLALGVALTSAVRAADITPAETRAIAEEGFIYGLPIVMNYAVMYAYAVDRDSGQFKARKYSALSWCSFALAKCSSMRLRSRRWRFSEWCPTRIG